MDKLTHYRQAVREILQEHHHPHLDKKHPDVEWLMLIDAERDHYQLLTVGWEGESRSYSCSLHLAIKDGKIWIHRDYIDTDDGIAGELIERGVSKEDIVLAFHAPYKRPYTEFAVA